MTPQSKAFLRPGAVETIRDGVRRNVVVVL